MRSIKNYLIRAEASIENADISIIRAFLGVLCLFWGIWVALPFETLNVPAWQPMIVFLGNERFVALLPLTAAAFSLVADIWNHRKFRALASLIVLAWWIFVLTSLIKSNTFSTGTPAYGLIAIYSGWVFYRDASGWIKTMR